MLILCSFIVGGALAGLFVGTQHIIAPAAKDFAINDNPRRHLYILLALFPLAFLLSSLLPHAMIPLIEFFQNQSEHFGSEGLYIRLISSMRSASMIGSPTASDILTMVLFWFVTYSVMTVLKRLVDLNRILKVSRKRLYEML